MPTLKTRMHEFRKAMNMQQSELAELVGARHETIDKLENDIDYQLFKLTMDIAKVFGETVEEVFEFQEEE